MKFFERIGQKKRVAEIVNKEYERYQKSKENEKPLAELHPEVKKALIENAEKALENVVVLHEKTPEDKEKFWEQKYYEAQAKIHDMENGIHTVITNRQNGLLRKYQKGEIKKWSGQEVPEFFEFPKIGMRKCPCRNAQCDRFWLTGIGVWGEGTGLAQDDARDIVEYFNKFPENITLMPNIDHPNYKGPK